MLSCHMSIPNIKKQLLSTRLVYKVKTSTVFKRKMNGKQKFFKGVINNRSKPYSSMKRSKYVLKNSQNLSRVKSSKQKLSNIWNQKLKCLEFVQTQSYIVLKNNQPIFGSKIDKTRQIASLTKMFTCYTALILAQQLNIKIQTTKFKVSQKATTIGGTTSRLVYGDLVTIKDLLYGMMLPSGNDAALTIAQGLGKILSKKISLEVNLSYQTYFILKINRLLSQLKLSNTRITNPHGLADPFNISTAHQIAIFGMIAMQNQKFRKIVGTQFYCSQVFNQRTGLTRNLNWRNTNKLLNNSNFYGIKTGVTEKAGPCFAGYFQKQHNKCIIVLLGSKTTHDRFFETQLIVKKLFKQPFKNDDLTEVEIK